MHWGRFSFLHQNIFLCFRENFKAISPFHFLLARLSLAMEINGCDNVLLKSQHMEECGFQVLRFYFFAG